MRAFMGHLSSGFGTDLVYSFAIIVISLMIYFGTKKLYELSNYKGINYFRQAFLFFAIAYFFRSIIKFLMVFLNLRTIIDFSPRVFGPITTIFFMYFSYLAIFYLIYSMVWKKLKGSVLQNAYILHFPALLISLFSVISRNMIVYIYINIFLILLLIIVIFSTTKKKYSHLHIIYILLFIFWMLNFLDILVPAFLQTYQLLIYLLSLGIFLLILYKVLKKTGPD